MLIAGLSVSLSFCPSMSSVCLLPSLYLSPCPSGSLRHVSCELEISHKSLFCLVSSSLSLYMSLFASVFLPTPFSFHSLLAFDFQSWCLCLNRSFLGTSFPVYLPTTLADLPLSSPYLSICVCLCYVSLSISWLCLCHQMSVDISLALIVELCV